MSSLATRLILSTSLLGLSAAAQAGDPSDYTLTGPSVVYLGVPATFEISGATNPTQGGAALFVAAATASGSPQCPAPLQGDCLDIPSPTATIGMLDFSNPGPRTFTATPPQGSPEGTYVLQSAAATGGQGYTSNVIEVQAVDPCTTFINSNPADETADVDIAAHPTLTFEGDTAQFWTFSIEGEEGMLDIDVNFSASEGTSTATLVPSEPMIADSDYTIYAENICGMTTEVAVHTSQAGFSLEPLIDVGFVLDIDLQLLVGLGIDIDAALGILAGFGVDIGITAAADLDNRIAFQLKALGGDRWAFLQVQVESDPLLPDAYVQVLGAPTRCYPANFSDGGWFSLIEPDFSPTGLDILGQLILNGRLTAGGTAVDLGALIGLRNNTGLPLWSNNGECPVDDQLECLTGAIDSITGIPLLTVVHEVIHPDSIPCSSL